MAAVESGLPGIGIPLRLGVELLHRSVLHSLATPAVNGHVRIVRKVNDHPPAPKLVEPIHEEEEEPRSAWEPSSPFESSRCKALLLEVLRRAAHDWVLYRSHSKLANREIAQDAYEWLFEEDEDHVSWRQRSSAVFMIDEGEAKGVRNITSFLSICEVLELDPEVVRTRVRQMDIETIISAGRPAETRKLKSGEVSGVEECGVMIGVDVNAMPTDHYETHYESYGSVATPGSLGLSDYSGMY
jgi:hypothetical protein